MESERVDYLKDRSILHCSADELKRPCRCRRSGERRSELQELSNMKCQGRKSAGFIVMEAARKRKASSDRGENRLEREDARLLQSVQH